MTKTTGSDKGPKQRKKLRWTGADGDAKPYVPSIALRSIDGHITRTGSTVTAWYRLSPQRWSFRSDEERWRLIQDIASQYSDLQGRWLHIRVTSRPYPVRAWAEAHVRNAHGKLPDVAGASSFDDYMFGEQRQLKGRAMSDKEVYVGVEITRRKLVDTLVDSARPVLRRIAPALLDAEVQALDAEIQHVDRVLAAPGLEGRPVTAEEMRWLLDRSCNLGLPTPRTTPGVGRGIWASEDLAALTDGSEADQEPYAPTVTVRGRAGDLAGIERHVAVLTVGLMDKLAIPERDAPWMQKTDALGMPLEWSARIYVRPSANVENELIHQASKVRSQLKHFADEHELDPPQELARQASRASDIESELNGQFGGRHTRVLGFWRVAVPGATRDEALSRAQVVLQHYRPQIALEHPEAQYHLRREFIPGEPLASKAYMRRGPVTWAAAAVPAATASVGDRRGALLGETTGSTQQPVAWDPWLSQEERAGSGLTAAVAELGGGKSFLCGGVVYKTLRTGARWTVLDPSGPLARLAELPELRPYSRVINLLDAEAGILNPYRVVPEPRREHYDTERAWRRDRAAASATRKSLCESALYGVLPYEIAHMHQTRFALSAAIREVGGGYDRDPSMVINQLRHDRTSYQEHAHMLYEALNDMREQLRPLIPEPDADPYAQRRDDRLTVLTMPGLALPESGRNPENWSDGERFGTQLLTLAGWLTQHMIYSGPPDWEAATGQRWQHVRKGVWIDEAFFLSAVPAGAQLMKRFSRDSRKWNVRVLLSSQLPSDFVKLEEGGIASLVDSVFIGRLSEPKVQSDALRLLGVPTGVGYEQVLAELAPPAQSTQAHDTGRLRQFIFADGSGGTERLTIDFSGSHLSGLRHVLDTNPKASVGKQPQPQLQNPAHPNHGETDRAHVLTEAHPAPAAMTVNGHKAGDKR